MKYNIIDTNQADHSIVVRFYTDKTPEAMLAVQVDEQGNVLRGRTDYSMDLPVPAPRGAALDAFIMGYAPTAWFERIEAVADGVMDTSLAFLGDSLGVEQSAGAVTLPADTLEGARARKLVELADWRYQKETAGVTVGGARIKTDRGSQAIVTSAFISMSQGLVSSVDWKAEGGMWVTLGLPQITGIAQAVVAHVQACFTLEKQFSEDIAAAPTIEAVQAITFPALFGV
jgi:predicted small integral membrane protein